MLLFFFIPGGEVAVARWQTWVTNVFDVWFPRFTEVGVGVLMQVTTGGVFSLVRGV